MSGIPSKVSTGAGISLGADGFSTSSGTFNAGTTPPTNGAVNVDAATYGGTFLSAVNTSGSSITMSVDATTNTLTVNGNVVVTGTVAEAAVSEGPLTITGGTVTTNTPFLQATQSWNAGGVTFTGLKVNITDTASAAGSLLMDYQVGGATKFSVTKAGTVSIATGATYQVNGTTVLSATALGSNVVSSSLTSIGTLASGAVPASLVTAGTFGAGTFAFQGDLSFGTNLTSGTNGNITTSAGYLLVNPVGNLYLRAQGSSTINIADTASNNVTICAGGGTMTYQGVTPTNTNTANALVLRNANGDFAGRNVTVAAILATSGGAVVQATNNITTTAGDFVVSTAGFGILNGSSARAISIGSGATPTTTVNYNLSVSNNLLATTDATYDIGASGATRFRDFYLSRNATIGGTLGVTGDSTISSMLTLSRGSSTALDVSAGGNAYFGGGLFLGKAGNTSAIIRSGNAIVIANGASAKITDNSYGNQGIGIMMVFTNSNEVALIACAGFGNALTFIYNDGNFSLSAGTASKLNITGSGGTQFNCENNRGASRNVYCIPFSQ